MTSPSRTHGSGPEPFDACPDGGRCWHECPLSEPSEKHPEGEGRPCWRVGHAAPFSKHNGTGEWSEVEQVEHGVVPRCQHIYLTDEVHRQYTKAVDDAQREHPNGDSAAFREAVARVQAASEKMQACVRSKRHEMPHRDVNGFEWNDDEDEKDEGDALPDVDETVAALDAIAAGDPEAAHSAADRILLAAVHDDIAAAYKRVIERAPWWASA